MFESKFLIFLEWLILKDRSKISRSTLSFVIALGGYLVTLFIYNLTQSYFASITLFTVILMAIAGDLYFNFIFLLILILIADYEFIPPTQSILSNSNSYEHLVIVVTIGTLTNSLIYFLRRALYFTNIAKVEAELAKKEAETANLAKNTFLANMSHEIRTPLGAIIGFSELIADPLTEPSEKFNYISIIKRNGELLSNIIKDILDLSKVEAGKLDINIKPNSLTEILHDIKHVLDLKAKEKGLELIFNKNEDVVDIIMTDAMRLRQILMNVIGNAIKFTNKGHVSLVVKNEMPPYEDKDKNYLSFIVKDTGIGMDSTQLHRLFGAFSQVHTDSQINFGGTGLGLNLSKKLSQLLGGDLVLTKTQKNHGSEFTITIEIGSVPQEQALPTTTDSHHSPISLSDYKNKLFGVKVLLAEDAEDLQLLTSHILKKAGAIVTTVNNGVEAIAKVTLNKFDVILMDIQMPLMGGYEATHKILNTGYRGSIVALTAHALSDERERCLTSGFSAYLTKPIDIKELIELVDQLSKNNFENSPKFATIISESSIEDLKSIH